MVSWLIDQHLPKLEGYTAAIMHGLMFAVNVVLVVETQEKATSCVWWILKNQLHDIVVSAPTWQLFQFNLQGKAIEITDCFKLHANMA